MQNISLSIEDNLFNIFPNLFFAYVIAENLSSDSIAQKAKESLVKESQAVKSKFEAFEDLAAEEPIASWRQAYGAMQIKPSKYRSSIESLIRRAVRGDDLSIFPAVDFYNSFSLKHSVPMGASDLTLLSSPEMVVRSCNPEKDSYTPLGGKAEDFPLIAGLPVYASGSTVICWALNCRDSAVTALRPETTRAIFVSEGVSAKQKEASITALEELKQSLESCGSTCSFGLVDGQNRNLKAA